MSLLAADATIAENGATQSRAAYARGHLADDIAFAKAVTSQRTPPTIHRDGTSSWATSTHISTGRFRDRDVDQAGSELVVLTLQPEGWRIRAIHWSSVARRR